MLIKTYESHGLTCNVSVNAPTTKTGLYAYRGDLVLEEGDVADSSGRRKPPRAVIKQAIALVDRDKLLLMVGALQDLALLPLFAERYRNDFAGGLRALFYVENLSKPLQVELDGVNYLLLPHDEGAVWNTLMEDMKLDKDDFKGQSAEDKVITMYNAVHVFKPKFGSAGFDEALTHTFVVKKEARGPV